MRVTYDPEADAVFIYLVEIGTGEVERSRLVDRSMEMGSVFACFNRDGQLVGIEVLGARRYVPQEVLDRLAELGVLTPDEHGYSPSDVRLVEAIGRFRAGGYDERLGFTVYDTLRYKRALEPLVAEEVDVLTSRLSGDVDPDRALEIIEAGIGPLNDLMAALHTKLLVARLAQHKPTP